MKLSTVLRMQVLKGNAPAIRKLLLSPHQVRLLKSLPAVTTSGKLAKALGVSLQNASAKLERLRAGGYLRRTLIADPTGGYMYEYTRTGGAKPWKTS
jgi:hypothetical protein